MSRGGPNTADELRRAYPLHWAVYTNDNELLKKVLEENAEMDLNQKDPRGRSPLILAVTLGHREMAYELMKRGADADSQNKEMWSVSHEAVSSGDPEVIREVIKYRDYQRNLKYSTSMKNTLEQLKSTPDFYAEMSWEFSSWVPFVSKMCPSDTYKIYKCGSTVRLDTTLVGFEGTSWRRGNQSFIFRISEQDGVEVPQVIVMDHNTQTANVQTLSCDESLEDFTPPEEAITFRMTTPISTTYIDVEKIGFERSRGGLLSWISSSERNERVNGYDCKVFNASNVDLVTKTRTEHLTEEDKARFKQEESSHPLSSVLNMVRSETAEVTPASADALGGITANEYLDKEFELQCDIGKSKQVARKSNTFKATLWLAEDYPLQLQEQVIPIVDLMASNSAHFARLNNFIRLQLPAGFPVKIEIPLFHVVSAKITFGRVNEPGPYVTPLDDVAADSSNAPPPVVIDERVFEIPSNYRTMDDTSGWWEMETPGASTVPHVAPAAGHYHAPSAQQQEEMLLQLAIQQSLQEANGFGGGASEEAVLGQAPAFGNGVPRSFINPMADQEARDLAIAIQESLRLSAGLGPSEQVEQAAPEDVQIGFDVGPPPQQQEDELQRILRLSKEEEERRAAELREQDEELQRVLELSKSEQ